MEVNWLRAYKMYSWRVDLSTYHYSSDFLNHFNDRVGPENVMGFESKFFKAVSEFGDYEVTGEVCYWKNYGTATSRNKITNKLLKHLHAPGNWRKFAISVKNVSCNPTYENFVALRNACNQPQGFATPLTFLSFYNPARYPMVDKHIADWWKNCRKEFGYEDHPLFSQRRNDGWIQTSSTKDSHRNWAAYLSWNTFCNKYKNIINNKFNLEWRARDVEMAVWMAWKNNVNLEAL